MRFSHSGTANVKKKLIEEGEFMRFNCCHWECKKRSCMCELEEGEL